MLTQLYSRLLRIVGLLAAVLSAISATLLWSATPPVGLRNIDPLVLRNSMVAVLFIFGVAATLIAAFSPARKWLLLKTAVFALAGFSNAAALGAGSAVPFQGTTSVIAVVCELGLAVLALVTFMDSVQKKNPQSKF